MSNTPLCFTAARAECASSSRLIWLNKVKPCDPNTQSKNKQNDTQDALLEVPDAARAEYIAVRTPSPHDQQGVVSRFALYAPGFTGAVVVGIQIGSARLRSVKCN